MLPNPSGTLPAIKTDVGPSEQPMIPMATHCFVFMFTPVIRIITLKAIIPNPNFFVLLYPFKILKFLLLFDYLIVYISFFMLSNGSSDIVNQLSYS